MVVSEVSPEDLAVVEAVASVDLAAAVLAVADQAGAGNRLIILSYVYTRPYC